MNELDRELGTIESGDASGGAGGGAGAEEMPGAGGGGIQRRPALFMPIEYFPMNVKQWRALFPQALLPWPLMKLAARDILEGVWHLHWHGVVHRDLKLDNVVVDDPAVHLSVAEVHSSSSSTHAVERVPTSMPRFVLIDLGCAHAGAVDPPEVDHSPPACGMAPGAVVPAREQEVQDALDDTLKAEADGPGGNMDHLAPEVSNAWAAGEILLQSTSAAERRRAVRNHMVPYGLQAVFATGVLLYELATGGRHPIPSYHERPGRGPGVSVPEYQDEEAAGGDWASGGGFTGVSGVAMSVGGGGRSSVDSTDLSGDGQVYPAWFVEAVRGMLRWSPGRRPSLFEVRRCLWREEALVGGLS